MWQWTAVKLALVLRALQLLQLRRSPVALVAAVKSNTQHQGPAIELGEIAEQIQ